MAASHSRDDSYEFEVDPEDICLERDKSLFHEINLLYVCNFCFKSGDREVAICKGPCKQPFHFDCEMENRPQSDKKIKKPGTRKIKQRGSPSVEICNSTHSVPDLNMETDIPEDFFGFEDISHNDYQKLINLLIVAELPYEKYEKFLPIDKTGYCSLCAEGNPGPCLICGKEGGNIYCDCCGKIYHIVCVEKWPLAQLTKMENGQVKLICPQHSCHSCFVAGQATLPAEVDGLVNCLMCPIAFHSENKCIAAGSEIVSLTQIVCPRHSVPNRKQQNIKFPKCCLCASGGSLISCTTCPRSFHVECLSTLPSEDPFICDDCQTRHYTKFGDIIWAKLGAHRWWPARILFPPEVPKFVSKFPHVRGDIVVEFFGTHDYSWVNTKRVFNFTKIDTNRNRGKLNSLDKFTQALHEASTELTECSTFDANVRNVEVRAQNHSCCGHRYCIKFKTNNPNDPQTSSQEVEIPKDPMPRSKNVSIVACNPSRIRSLKAFKKKLKEVDKNMEALKKNQHYKYSDFEFMKLMGHGRFGKLYHARHKKTGLEVAIKKFHFIKKKSIFNSHAGIRLYCETSFHSLVNHPNIIKFIDYFFSEDAFFIVMDYAPDGSLFQFLNKKKKEYFPENIAAKYTFQLASALNTCHMKGFFHGDLKLENVLIDKEGNLRLCDFGLSWPSAIGRDRGCVGTPEYMAPEILKNQKYNQFVDHWSLGVVIYELLCGKTPFYSEDQAEINKKILDLKYTMPRTIQGEARKIIRQLLKLDPLSRLTLKQVMAHKWIRNWQSSW